jgi:hypothetical protein
MLDKAFLIVKSAMCLTVLFVDDEQLLAEMGKDMLERLG